MKNVQEFALEWQIDGAKWPELCMNQTKLLRSNGVWPYRRQQSKDNLQQTIDKTIRGTAHLNLLCCLSFSCRKYTSEWLSFATAVMGMYILPHAGAQLCNHMLTVMCLEGGGMYSAVQAG